jgi:nucleotide-binding universal stress UspA family protein
MTFCRVIVAFDGSPQAEDALALALRLRDPDEGALTLACVVSGGRWHVGAHAHRPDATVPEEVDSLFADACARMIPPGVRVRRRAPVAPSPARGLTELAESESADLVVIGSSRHAEPGRIRLERTAGRLLQGAPCAVAVAPGGLRSDEPLHHVGIAYDGSPEADAALDAGYELAACQGAAVTLAYAIPTGGVEPEDGRRRAQGILDAAADAAPPGVNPATKLVFGAPAQAIRDASDGIVDLLVTGSRGYGPMQRALMGSVSEMLVEGAPQPVLVLPRRPRSTSPRESAALERSDAR